MLFLNRLYSNLHVINIFHTHDENSAHGYCKFQLQLFPILPSFLPKLFRTDILMLAHVPNLWSEIFMPMSILIRYYVAA